mmetsp:Transcript_7295/g.26489  ORF Transcript_7295/g.26489 Transcript_7295/m.26489 type:complete len:152 (-) Transcript_7295:151-606(-)
MVVPMTPHFQQALSIIALLFQVLDCHTPPSVHQAVFRKLQEAANSASVCSVDSCFEVLMQNIAAAMENGTLCIDVPSSSPFCATSPTRTLMEEWKKTRPCLKGVIEKARARRDGSIRLRFAQTEQGHYWHRVLTALKPAVDDAKWSFQLPA